MYGYKWSRVVLAAAVGLALSSPPDASAGGSDGYLRKAGLLVTEVPEGPVRTIWFEIEIPHAYGLEGGLVVPNTALASAMQLEVTRLENGNTYVQGVASLPEPLRLSGYLLHFSLRMPVATAVPRPVVLRRFTAWLDSGWASYDVDVDLLVEDGLDGVGTLP